MRLFLFIIINIIIACAVHALSVQGVHMSMYPQRSEEDMGGFLHHNPRHRFPKGSVTELQACSCSFVEPLWLASFRNLSVSISFRNASVTKLQLCLVSPRCWGFDLRSSSYFAEFIDRPFC